jgi:hypothetical protein
MAQFLGDIAFLLEMVLVAGGLVLLHRSRQDGAGLLRAAALVLLPARRRASVGSLIRGSPRVCFITCAPGRRQELTARVVFSIPIPSALRALKGPSRRSPTVRLRPAGRAP